MMGQRAPVLSRRPRVETDLKITEWSGLADIKSPLQRSLEVAVREWNGRPKYEYKVRVVAFAQRKYERNAKERRRSLWLIAKDG